MPYINRKPFEDNKIKFGRKRQYKKKQKSTGNLIAYNEVYNTDKWRKLRALKLMDNPLCEMCEAEGKVIPALDVHHITPILEDIDKAFDYYNLMSLCRKCHYTLHNQLRREKRNNE